MQTNLFTAKDIRKIFGLSPTTNPYDCKIIKYLEMIRIKNRIYYKIIPSKELKDYLSTILN